MTVEGCCTIGISVITIAFNYHKSFPVRKNSLIVDVTRSPTTSHAATKKSAV